MKSLAAPLPAGEQLLWQGTPRWLPFARETFYAKLVFAYVGLLIGWCMVAGFTSGDPWTAVAAALRFAGIAGGAIALLGGLAWALARSTTFSLTSARFLIEYGVAMPKTLNIPFSVIENVALCTNNDGTGDLVLTLAPAARVNYILLWPHVRPWHFSRVQPMLRAVPDAHNVAQILSRALSANAAQSPAVLSGAMVSEHGRTEIFAT